MPEINAESYDEISEVKVDIALSLKEKALQYGNFNLSEGVLKKAIFQSTHITKKSVKGNNSELPFVEIENEAFYCPVQKACFFNAVFS